jgi:hypothetical protein
MTSRNGGLKLETKDLPSIGFLEWEAKCLLWNVLLLFVFGFSTIVSS